MSGSTIGISFRCWLPAHSKDISLQTHFDLLGQEFYSLYCSLQLKDPIGFSLTAAQQAAFNAFFARTQDKYLILQGLNAMASVRHLGLIAFRMMMTFTAMRIPETGDFSTRQQCREEDFNSTLSIIRILVRHVSYIIAQLPAEAKAVNRGNKKERFFEGLPERFTFKEMVEIAKNNAILERTAKRYMVVFCDKGPITRESH